MLNVFRLHPPAHLAKCADEDAVPVFALPLLPNEQDLVDKMRATIENAHNNAAQRRKWEPDSLRVFEHRLQAIVQVTSDKVTLCHLCCVAHLTADTAYSFTCQCSLQCCCAESRAN